LKYGDCAVTVEMVVEGGITEIPIYSKSFPITEFKQVFKTGQRADFGVCSVYLTWTDLVLNDHQASGCGEIDITCPGINYPYPIGCFEDDSVVPECFGTCPNNCSSHGNCVTGFCQCEGNWNGTDCSQLKGCPNDCSGHGDCTIDTSCHCDNGYAGTDCSIIIVGGTSSEGPSGPKSRVAIAIGVLVPLLLVAGIGIGIYVWYRRKNRIPTPQFTQLDLISAEEEEDELVGE